MDREEFISFIESHKSTEGFDNLLLFTAMRRTGHHAILWYILAAYKTKCLHVNMMIQSPGTFILCNNRMILLGHPTPESRKINGTVEYNPFLSTFNPTEDAISNHKVSIVSGNFENKPPSVVFQNWNFLSSYAENSNTCISYFCILRNPISQFASSTKLDGVEWPPSSNYIDSFLTLWHSYAEAFINETPLPEETLFILYDRWIVDSLYRRHILRRLNLEYTDEAFSWQSFHGNFSSFKVCNNRVEIEEKTKQYIPQSTLDLWEQCQNKDSTNFP
tara:strand:- start:41 stop:865 length:825 start_codon:yes stop_codon:yes gene_type:complete